MPGLAVLRDRTLVGLAVGGFFRVSLGRRIALPLRRGFVIIRPFLVPFLRAELKLPRGLSRFLWRAPMRGVRSATKWDCPPWINHLTQQSLQAPVAHRVDSKSESPAVEAFFLDQIDFDVAETATRARPRGRSARRRAILLLFCEHPTIITVGRGGSPGEIATQSGLLHNQQIEVRWVNRGGGCQIHCPGQLAIYPIVPPPVAWFFRRRVRRAFSCRVAQRTRRSQCAGTPAAGTAWRLGP